MFWPLPNIITNHGEFDGRNTRVHGEFDGRNICAHGKVENVTTVLTENLKERVRLR
jgi:hypothetical protein